VTLDSFLDAFLGTVIFFAVIVWVGATILRVRNWVMRVAHRLESPDRTLGSMSDEEFFNVYATKRMADYHHRKD
jgi:hypothetical protein